MSEEHISQLQESRRAYCEKCGYEWWTRPWRYKNKSYPQGHAYPIRCPNCGGWCTADYVDKDVD